jgi:hypothetical protein
METGYYISAICPVITSRRLFKMLAIRQVKLTNKINTLTLSLAMFTLTVVILQIGSKN